MPNRNGVPFDLKRAEVRTRKTDYCDPVLKKITLRQGTSGSSRHHFCLLKACRISRGIDTQQIIGKNSKPQGQSLTVLAVFGVQIEYGYGVTSLIEKIKLNEFVLFRIIADTKASGQQENEKV